MKAAATVGPPSSQTWWTSRSARPPGPPWGPACAGARWARRRRGPVPSAGRSRSPITTRSGWLGYSEPSGRRAVSWGSSVRAVPVPTRIAPAPRALGVDVGAGRLAGDPLAGAVGRGAAAVEGGRELPGHPGPAGGDQVRPRRVQRTRLVGQHAALDLDAALGAATPRPRPRSGWGRTGRRPRDSRPRHTGPWRTVACARCGCTVRA